MAEKRSKTGLFARASTGSIAVMAAMLFSTLLISVGGVIDLSEAMRVKRYAQNSADAAALAAARAVRNGATHQDAIALAETLFNTRMQGIERVDAEVTFDIDENSATGEIISTGETSIEVPGYLLNLTVPSAMQVSTLSEARVAEAWVDLYLHLLIDSTSSMQPLIDGVKGAALGLEPLVRAALLARGCQYRRAIRESGVLW